MKTVSPFEYAIRQAAGCEQGYRPESPEEKQARLKEKAIDFAKRIKIKKS